MPLPGLGLDEPDGEPHRLAMEGVGLFNSWNPSYTVAMHLMIGEHHVGCYGKSNVKQQSNKDSSTCLRVSDAGLSLGLLLYRFDHILAVAKGVKPKTTVRERCDGALPGLIPQIPSLWGTVLLGSQQYCWDGQTRWAPVSSNQSAGESQMLVFWVTLSGLRRIAWPSSAVASSSSKSSCVHMCLSSYLQ